MPSDAQLRDLASQMWAKSHEERIGLRTATILQHFAARLDALLPPPVEGRRCKCHPRYDHIWPCTGKPNE